MSLDTSHAANLESGPSTQEPSSWRRMRPAIPRRSTAAMDRQPNVLAKIYEFVTAQRTDDAIDMLYDVVDEQLTAQNFSICNRMLENLALDQVNTDIIVGALSITLSAKEALPSRERFAQRAEEKLARTLPREQVDELLRGLR